MIRQIRSFSVRSVVALVVACSTTAIPPQETGTPTALPMRAIRVALVAGTGGPPVAGARVCVAAARGPEACTEADGDGSAALSVPPGTYFVRASGPAGQRWQDATRATDLSAGDARLVIELTRLRRISGRIRDESGAFVVGAEACAHPASDEPPPCARSAMDGTYAIDTKSGVYRLEVSGPSGGRLVPQWARGRAFLEEADVLDARAADVPDVDVTLVRGVVLSGTVTFAGQVVESAQVCIRTLAAPLPWQCERTDKRGHYAALREPGTYYLWTVPPAGIRAVPQWFDGAATGAGASPVSLPGDRTIDVDLVSGPQLSGVVRTTAGEVVANTLVCVDTAFTTGRICRETDGNGRYAITTRPATYVVSVYPPAQSGLVAGFWDGKRTWKDADEIRVDRDVTLDLTVARGITVAGTVQNARGEPVAGATVNLVDGRSGAAASTDTDAAGHFAAVVPAGRFSLEVFPPLRGNLLEKAQTVEVGSAMLLQITLDDSVP